MNQTDNPEQRERSPQEPRRPYRAPRLCRYGTVKALTTAGSGSQQEPHPGINKNRYP
jgi:hypothetical protein